jgi:hypothetical protein
MSPLVQISIRGANVAIINGKVYAAIVPPPNAATWIVGQGPGGTITFTDQASGFLLSVPATDLGTQAQASPTTAATAVTSWNLTEFSDEDGDDGSPVEDPAQLASGFYSIQDPASGNYLFRNRDRGLLPHAQVRRTPGPVERHLRSRRPGRRGDRRLSQRAGQSWRWQAGAPGRVAAAPGLQKCGKLS